MRGTAFVPPASRVAPPRGAARARRPGALLALAAMTALVAPSGPAAAQESETFTSRDPQLDARLDAALLLERQGDGAGAARQYLEVEQLIERARVERAKVDPQAPEIWPVTEVGPGLDRGVIQHVRERVAALAPDARREYLRSTDPRAREALEVAAATRVPEELEAVVARWPLSAAAQDALPLIVDLSIERGEVSRAVRALARIEASAKEGEVRRRASLLRLHLAVARGDEPGARDALAAFEKHGGDPAAARAHGSRQVSPRDLVATLGRGAGSGSPTSFDPGGPARTIGLQRPELEPELLRRLPGVPLHQQPVWDPLTRHLLVADAQTVRAVALAPGALGWTYTPDAEGRHPSRVEVEVCRPALGPGRIYATLHLNRVAEVTRGAAPDDKATVTRQPDWRVVALDRATGALAWDAANLPGFEAMSRAAEWVSAPLHVDGGVFVTVLERSADLRAVLVRLDGATGEVRLRTFLASRPGHDHLGLAAPPPPPSLSPQGLVLVATGLGVVAAVDPVRGEPVWLARYPAAPGSSEPDLVRSARRFRPCEPLAARDPVVVAPVDGAEVVALDGATGRAVWRAPRGDARLATEGPAGEVILLGRRLVVLDRATGRVLVRGPLLGSGRPHAARASRGADGGPGDAVQAPPVILGHELVACTATDLLRISLRDGSVLSRFHVEPGEGGAPALAGEDGLVIVGPSAVVLWSTLEERLREVERRIGGGPRGDLALGRLRAHRGEVEQALAHLERAARPGGLEETQRLIARQAGFDLLAAQALAAKEDGELTPFLAAAARAIELVWGPEPGDREPPTRDEQALAVRSADLLRAYADAHMAGGDPRGWTQAACALHAIVRLPPATLVRLEGGARVDAREWGRLRLRELVARRGPDVLGAPALARAEEAYRQARAADAAAGLARLAELWPAAPRAADARWALAESNERKGLRAEAAAELERFLREHPLDPRRADALGRLVRTNVRLRRTTAARRALEALEALEPETRIPGADGGPDLPARAFIAQQRATLPAGGGDALGLARAVASLDGPLRRTWRGPTDLTDRGAGLVLPGGAWVDPASAGVVVLRRPGAPRPGAVATDVLELRRAADGALLGAIPGLVHQEDPPLVVGGIAPPPRSSRLDPALAAGVLVVPFADRLEGWAASGDDAGARRWVTPIPAGEGVIVVGPLPVHELRAAGEAVVVLTGRNELVSVDAATGRVRWRRPLAARASAGLVVVGGVVVAASSAPAGLIGLRLADGAPLWADAPQAQAAAALLSTPRALDVARLVAVEGQRVVCVDAATGKRRWSTGQDGWWPTELQPSLDGRRLVVRGHGADGPGLRVLEVEAGQELWTDLGWGASRPGAPASKDAPRAMIDLVVVGEELLYSYRSSGGRAELWAQELELGRDAWRFSPPRGSIAWGDLVETSTTLLVARQESFGARVSVAVLARGTGRLVETLQLPGRRLVGAGLQAREGALVASTDRGLFGLAAFTDDGLARETIAAALALEAGPDAPRARARLARLLEVAGREEEAALVLQEGLLAEGLRAEAFDRLFETLAALSEGSTERRQMQLEVRRMPRPPEIDGELSDWWRPWSTVEMSGPRHVVPIQVSPTASPGRWSGDEDLSARLFLGWDERHLYLALDVQDTNLRPYDSEAPRWIGDCLLMAIDVLGDGGEMVGQDDQLLSLALTLPKQKDEEEKPPEQQGEQDDQQKPDGSYFVRRKDDGSGAVYEVAIPWSLFAKNGAALNPQGGPPAGLTFGLDLVLTDDDGDRFEGAAAESGPRGALKTLQLTPGVLLHEEKSRLWKGFVPARFARVSLR